MSPAPGRPWQATAHVLLASPVGAPGGRGCIWLTLSRRIGYIRRPLKSPLWAPQPHRGLWCCPMDFPIQVSNLVEVLRHRARHQPDRRAYAFLQNGDVEQGALELPGAGRGGPRDRGRSAGARGPRGTGLPPLPARDGVHQGLLRLPVRRGRGDPASRGEAEPAPAAGGGPGRASLAPPDRVRTRPLLDDGGSRLPEFEAMRWIVSDELQGSPDAWEPPPVGASTLAYLQYTSGSTAAPKGVMVTHGNLMRHCAHIEQAWGYSPDGASMTWVPHFHDYGLVDGIIEPLYVGIPCYVMSPAAFYMRPAALAPGDLALPGDPHPGTELGLRALPAEGQTRAAGGPGPRAAGGRPAMAESRSAPTPPAASWPRSSPTASGGRPSIPPTGWRRRRSSSRPSGTTRRPSSAPSTRKRWRSTRPWRSSSGSARASARS